MNGLREQTGKAVESLWWGPYPTFQGKLELTLLAPCLGLVEIKLKITERTDLVSKHVGSCGKAYCLKLNLGLRWMHLGSRSGFSTYYLGKLLNFSLDLYFLIWKMSE